MPNRPKRKSPGLRRGSLVGYLSVDQYFATYTQVLTNNTINEIKGGLNGNFYTLEPIAGWGETGARRPPDTEKILFDVFSGREIQGYTVIEEGLASNDRVVTSGALLLNNGLGGK